MTRLQPIRLDPGRALAEVDEVEAFLDARPAVPEAEVRAFLASRSHLIASMAMVDRPARVIDRWASEVDLYGKHTCDYVAGDAAGGHFTLVELEDATPTAVFKAEPATPYLADRYLRGFSQVVDWLCLMDGMRQTPQFASYWGSSSPALTGLVVVGRAADVDAEGRSRMEWRNSQIRVNGSRVLCVTYEELIGRLRYQLRLRVETGR